MLDDFLAFLITAKHKSVTRASKDLHLTQPAVTKKLKSLEQNYNSKFYVRYGKGIELTATGKIFLRNIKIILRQHERWNQNLRAARRTTERQFLTVGGSSSPSAEMLPSIIAKFKRMHPDVQVNFRTATRFMMEHLVLNGEVDIAILNYAPHFRSLHIEPYGSEQLVGFVPSNHPLVKKHRLTLKEFELVPLVIRHAWIGKGTTERFLRELKSKGLNANIILRCESPEAVKTAVRSKMGMGILFREAVELEVKSGEFKLVKLPVKNFETRSYIIYRKDTSLSAEHQEFLKLLHGQQRALGKAKQKSIKTQRQGTDIFEAKF